MMQCEMCGAEGPLKQTKVEGATLKLCSDCQETGEVVEESSSKTERRSKSRSRQRSSSKTTETVAKDLGETVKQAREERGLSMQQLGQELGVKTSVVRRVENESLTPDKKLAKKLEQELDITVYETHSTADVEMESESTGGDATIGDVATVRKRD